MSRIKYLIKRANLRLYIRKIPGVMLVINQHALITHGAGNFEPPIACLWNSTGITGTSYFPK